MSENIDGKQYLERIHGDKQTRKEKIESLNWVTLVAKTERENATYKVDTDLCIVRTAHEVHELENLGVTVTGFSAVPEHGARVFVR